MLTKEEAQRLIEVIRGRFYEDIIPEVILLEIKELTEKPKCEIKIGDIYKDYSGKFIEVIATSDLGHIETKVFNGGLCAWGEIDEHGLDLSKKYKIVEIEE